MKIAVLAPSPVPYTIGGVEHTSFGLYNAINNLTRHEAELIKVPSRERSFWELVDNYHHFYNLDLDHFDMVITMKYPCWMLQHRNLICWTFHCLRGLYDTYHLTGLPLDVVRGNKHIDIVLDYIDNHPLPETLAPFFQQLALLRANMKDVPEEYFSFPGPFIRKIIRYMDFYAFSRNRVK